MKKNKQNAAVAQGAKQFDELKKHEQIMKRLDEVTGYQYVDYGGESPYVGWRENKLSDEELKEIMERGNHDEIMHMINRYNHAVSEEEQHKTNRPGYFSLPEEIQEMLAKRGDSEEIDAYLACQGFGAKGQNVILARGNHDEIMSYVRRHGLLPEQQKKLLARGLYGKQELKEHIHYHGLCDELLDDIFDRFKAGNKTALIEFIKLHELPVAYQKEMLKRCGSDLFEFYIGLYGLWKDAHETLVQVRSDEDIKKYIQRHRYLAPEAEDLLVAMYNHELNKVYTKYKYNLKADDHFVQALLSQRPLDYDTITMILLSLGGKACGKCDTKDDEVMRDGSDVQVKARIEEKRLLSFNSFCYLFFRNEPELFESYLNSCEHGLFFFTPV